MEKRDFFISYTQTDKAWAVWIANILKKKGYSVNIQSQDILPGDDFLDKMEEFLETSRNFIAVWSKQYAHSRFCMLEFRAAVIQYTNNQMGRFLIVRIDEYPVKRLISTIVRIEPTDMSAASETKLVEAVLHAVPLSGEKQSDTPNSSNDGNQQKDEDFWKSLFHAVFPLLIAIACIATILVFASILRKEQSGDSLFLKGQSYYKSENYSKAREYYERAAAKENAKAMNSLAWLYRKGLGVNQDYAMMLYYYEQAAERGDSGALNSMGYLYQTSLGVEQDYLKAQGYYEQAALKGNKAALYHLGELYEYGQGVEINYDTALDYYQKAAPYEKDAADALKKLREKMNS